jgi:hypothetical protein
MTIFGREPVRGKRKEERGKRKEEPKPQAHTPCLGHPSRKGLHRDRRGHRVHREERKGKRL